MGRLGAQCFLHSYRTVGLTLRLPDPYPRRGRHSPGSQKRGPNMTIQVGRALLLGAAVLSAAASAETAPKTYRLAATPDTVQWGWLDPKEPPKLTIESGDIVSIETLMHAKDQIQKGTTMEKIVELRKANPGGGPHSISGPIFVKGAKPGDVMRSGSGRSFRREWGRTSTS